MNLSQMGIAAITFDLDDTLWACDPVINRAEQVYYQWLREHCPAACEKYSIDQLREQRRELLISAPELTNDVSEWRLRATRELLVRFDMDPLLAHDAFEIFLSARQKVEFYPDVLDALQELSFHYRLGSLTNGNADLKRIGVDHLFDTALYASLDLPAKPAPAMYHKASQELGVSPERILHVGDNAITDIEGARNAGYKTAWINRGTLVYPDNIAEADFNITTLSDLVKLAPVIPR